MERASSETKLCLGIYNPEKVKKEKRIKEGEVKHTGRVRVGEKVELGKCLPQHNKSGRGGEVQPQPLGGSTGQELMESWLSEENFHPLKFLGCKRST